jgi:hypothetical protein
MAEIIKHSQKEKPNTSSDIPRLLTPQEIASLREDSRKSSEASGKWFREHGVKKLD